MKMMKYHVYTVPCSGLEAYNKLVNDVGNHGACSALHAGKDAKNPIEAAKVVSKDLIVAFDSYPHSQVSI